MHRGCDPLTHPSPHGVAVPAHVHHIRTARLPRYILLLQTMRKRTPSSSPDAAALTKACELINGVLEKINRGIDKQEQQRLHLVRSIIDSVQGDTEVGLRCDGSSHRRKCLIMVAPPSAVAGSLGRCHVIAGRGCSIHPSSCSKKGP